MRAEADGRCILAKDHGIRAREAVLADVALIIGNIVQNQWHFRANVNADAEIRAVVEE
jgi:hypothetical protein